MYIPRVGRFLPNRIRVYPPEEVRVIADNEVAPQRVGLKSSDVEAIWRAVEVYYKMGLQPAMALCIRRNGHVILNRTIGHARGNSPGSTQEPVLATPKTLFNMFSASKCVTAMLLHKLIEEGRVNLHAPVAKYIPAFSQRGKGKITVYQVLTHSAGIPNTPSGLISIELVNDKSHIIDRICQLPLETPPGKTQAYHALHSGFIVAEIVERITGNDIQSHLTSLLCAPLGFSHLRYGVSPRDLPFVAQESFTGPKPFGPPRKLFRTSVGMEFQDAVSLANHPDFLTGVVPSCNIIATADEVSRYFELLLRMGTLDGVEVFKKRTVTQAVAEYRKGRIDGVIGLPVRFGLGFMLGGKYLSFYGPDTQRAFGHLGFTNILAYADPERDISVAFLNNGKPLVAIEMMLWMRVMWVIASRIPKDYGGKGCPGPNWK
ncbi:MAG: serine hydrolase domain-containing protein [Myxococcota bacterium]|nr:serine hydrolase domain-containing protein [Myxococcota bacterium]